jgi:hypothetical protein
MSDRLLPGPYKMVEWTEGKRMPFYVIPFDKRGRDQAPLTRAHLLEEAGREGYTDIFLFSHGWNNDWTVATKRYEHFLNGYMDLRRNRGLPVPETFKPLLVGVFWPSTALVFGEEERGPAMAAATETEARVANERREVAELADELPPELAQKEALTDAEARELAQIVRPFYGPEEDELQVGAPESVDEIVRVWRAASGEPEDFSDEGTGTVGTDTASPQVAGIGDFLGKLDPRNVIRLLTVRQMKDRAGTVGTFGVGPLLLRELLGLTQARVHLLGHSYGAKVVLSAIASGDSLPRKVESLLLLQPAVSHLCFAERVPGTERGGGYQSVLERVNRPILSTFSAQDVPLNRLFHWALTRQSDLGEAKIAAVGEPPSRFAALGGFGPRGAGERLIDVNPTGQHYTLDPQVRVYGLRGTGSITGHGDISNETTWWALYSMIFGQG